jgi:hypothetical protein
VAQFRVRVVWNCDATVRTWGGAVFGPPTVRDLAYNDRSEPKFEQIFECFKGKYIFSNCEGHKKIFKGALNFSETSIIERFTNTLKYVRSLNNVYDDYLPLKNYLREK